MFVIILYSYYSSPQGLDPAPDYKYLNNWENNIIKLLIKEVAREAASDEITD